MCIDQLPPELQIQIFSYLQAPDLKAARGVSTKFRDHASVSLFRSVVVCARYKAMQAFQNISLHPIYQTYVKEIIFDGSAYDGRLARNELAYQSMANEFDDLRGMVSWARHSRFKQYQQLFEDQQGMKDSHVLLHTIAKALDWMPNITSIVYSPSPHLIPVETSLMKDIVPRGVGRIRSTPYMDSIHYLIGALYISQYTGIRNFRVERLMDVNLGNDFSIDAFSFSDSTHAEAGKYFFSHLHAIDLDISVHPLFTMAPGSVAEDSIEKLENMAALLSESQDLRQLSFHLSTWRPNPNLMYGHLVPDGQPIFPHLGLGATWPKLERLTIEGVYAEEVEFQKLIARHRDTLKSLRFEYCSLFSGKWSNIVDEVVYGTRIGMFVLGHVNETTVGGLRFEDLPDRDSWMYEGEIRLNADGERYFDETPQKSIYAWRNQDINAS